MMETGQMLQISGIASHQMNGLGRVGFSLSTLIVLPQLVLQASSHILKERIMYRPIPILILVYFFLLPSPSYAQSIRPIVCGDEILFAETSANEVFHDYRLEISAGTKLNITIAPIGSTFNLMVFLYHEDGKDFYRVNDVAAGGIETISDLNVSSSNPIMRVLGIGPNVTSTSVTTDRQSSYFGAYQISLGCTLRDGTVIEPGDTMTADTGSGGSTGVVPAPVAAFSGTGFPGLAPVDFANVSALPLSVGGGTMTPNNSEITAFTFDANAGDVFQLDFTRLAGNLNLGLVVLSASNEVVFQASLVTSESLSTRLTLPSAGVYTIGVFRVDLLPPGDPQATAFQVTGTLNP